jgi:hypothetical protein
MPEDKQPAAEEEFEIILRSGRRYAFGVCDEEYVIWDKEASGEPVTRFAGTPEGHDEGSAEFRRLEHRSWWGPWNGAIRVIFLVSVAGWLVASVISTIWARAIEWDAYSFAWNGEVHSGPPAGLTVTQTISSVLLTAWVACLVVVGFEWVWAHTAAASE